MQNDRENNQEEASNWWFLSFEEFPNPSFVQSYSLMIFHFQLKFSKIMEQKDLQNIISQPNLIATEWFNTQFETLESKGLELKLTNLQFNLNLLQNKLETQLLRGQEQLFSGLVGTD